MPKPDNIQRCISEAVATAHDLDVDMLELGKALIRTGVLLLQREMCIRLPQWTQLDACRWALEGVQSDG